MIFSDIKTFNETIGYSRYLSYHGNGIIQVDSIKKSSNYKDIDEMVESLYSSSPPITTHPSFDGAENNINVLFNQDEDSDDEIQQEVVEDESNKGDDENKNEKNEIEDVVSLAVAQSTLGDNDAFKILPFSRDSDTNALRSSLLSEQLGSSANSSNGIKLSIYPPKSNVALDIHVPPKFTVKDVIVRVLNEHKKNNLNPKLEYDKPSKYELRMHEGDGDPDTDFPAFKSEYTVSEISQQSQSNDFCLCRIDEFNSDDGSDNPTPTKFKSKNPLPNFRVNGDTNSVSDDRGDQRTSDGTVSTKLSLAVNAKSLTIYVAIHNSNNKLTLKKIDDNLTLRDILPKLANNQKLRLYTDEYVFTITPEDQYRLNLMSSNVDMDVPIKLLGVTEFELRRKYYADTVRQHRVKNIQETKEPSKELNDSVVMQLKHWNVIKKNRYGISQPRRFGFDGKRVYNARRLEASRNPGTVSGMGMGIGGTNSAANVAAKNNGSVSKESREVSQIKKIRFSKDDSDNKTFCITWVENGREFEIEYTCESSKDCSDIVGRIKYILNKRNTNSMNLKK